MSLERSLPSVAMHASPCSPRNLAITLDCTHNKPLYATCFMLSLDDLKQFSWQPWKTYIPCDSDPEVEVQSREVTYVK